MRVQLLSDVHLDFHPVNHTRALVISTMLHPDAEVVVIAGDVSNADDFCGHVEEICKAAPQAQVIVVPGNHDFFGCPNPDEHLDRLYSWKGPPNFRLLYNTVAEIGGVIFAGTTLWYPEPEAPPAQRRKLEGYMADFQCIRGFTPWVYEEHDAALSFLREAATRVDVVVTHHLPHERCTDPHYAGSPLNVFFNSGAADKMEALPPYWFFGHTHRAFDLEERGCRYVCNPLGYPNRAEGARKGYTARKLLEITPREVR